MLSGASLDAAALWSASAAAPAPGAWAPEIVYLRRNGQVRTRLHGTPLMRAADAIDSLPTYSLVRRALCGPEGAGAASNAPIRPEMDYLSHNGRTCRQLNVSRRTCSTSSSATRLGLVPMMGGGRHAELASVNPSSYPRSALPRLLDRVSERPPPVRSRRRRELWTTSTAVGTAPRRLEEAGCRTSVDARRRQSCRLSPKSCRAESR